MKHTRFCIGQIIQHKLFDYRGIIFDVDFNYSGTDEWYESVAHSRPSKNQPWYKVLVDNATLETYVAEQNLSIAETQQDSINNPFMGLYFDKSANNIYTPKIIKN